MIAARLQYSSPSQGEPLAKVKRFSFSRAPLASGPDRRVPFVGVRNSCGAFGVHSLIRALYQPSEQTSRVFAVLLGKLPLSVVAHEQQRSERSLSWVTRNMLRVTRCL